MLNLCRYTALHLFRVKDYFTTMNLNKDIEAFRRLLRKCPKCGSAEGFWIASRLRQVYFQCKHCGTIIEATEIIELPKRQVREGKIKEFLRKLGF